MALVDDRKAAEKVNIAIAFYIPNGCVLGALEDDGYDIETFADMFLFDV